MSIIFGICSQAEKTAFATTFMQKNLLGMVFPVVNACLCAGLPTFFTIVLGWSLILAKCTTFAMML